MFRARNALFFPRKIHDKSGPVNAFYAGFGRLAELSEKPGAKAAYKFALRAPALRKDSPGLAQTASGAHEVKAGFPTL